MNLNSQAIVSNRFLKTWDFEHQTIIPHFHQSNGLVEHSIQTIKCTL